MLLAGCYKHLFNLRFALMLVAFLRIVKALFMFSSGMVFKVIDFKNHPSGITGNISSLSSLFLFFLFSNFSFFFLYIYYFSCCTFQKVYFRAMNSKRERNEWQRKCNRFDALKTLNYCPIISRYPFAITLHLEMERYQVKNFERVNSARCSSNCFCF